LDAKGPPDGGVFELDGSTAPVGMDAASPSVAAADSEDGTGRAGASADLASAVARVHASAPHAVIASANSQSRLDRFIGVPLGRLERGVLGNH
jgi:hypothetical protein